MNRGQTTVTTLLAVVTVLLGLNLIVKTSPAAVGQEDERPPYVTGIAWRQASKGSSVQHLYRTWSDGRLEQWAFSGCEFVGNWERVPR